MKLRLRPSHFCDHKFRQNFQDCVYLISTCGQDIGNITHLLVHCPSHHYKRKNLFPTMHEISEKISEQSDSTIRRYELDIY